MDPPLDPPEVTVSLSPRRVRCREMAGLVDDEIDPRHRGVVAIALDQPANLDHRRPAPVGPARSDTR
jgi:hypothetical protein